MRQELAYDRPIPPKGRLLMTMMKLALMAPSEPKSLALGLAHSAIAP